MIRTKVRPVALLRSPVLRARETSRQINTTTLHSFQGPAPTTGSVLPARAYTFDYRPSRLYRPCFDVACCQTCSTVGYYGHCVGTFWARSMFARCMASDAAICAGFIQKLFFTSEYPYRAHCGQQSLGINMLYSLTHIVFTTPMQRMHARLVGGPSPVAFRPQWAQCRSTCLVMERTSYAICQDSAQKRPAMAIKRSATC